MCCKPPDLGKVAAKRITSEGVKGPCLAVEIPGPP